MSAEMLYLASTWVLPVIIAITLHEAAHGLAAYVLGDTTAWRLGRVSSHPLKHIDPFGTLLMPAMLLLLRAPFLFGYAKPVPSIFPPCVTPAATWFWWLRQVPRPTLSLPRWQPFFSTPLPFCRPKQPGGWRKTCAMHSSSMWFWLSSTCSLCPPLDGGRVAVGLLPNFLAIPLARLEPYGVMILLTLMLLPPIVGPQLGLDFNIISRLISGPTEAILRAILRLTGNG